MKAKLAELVDAVVLGAILNKVQVQVLCFVYLLQYRMPQLDTLTYLTQYVYLLITFVAVYFFVLSFIIPKTLSSLKVRQKLNSLNTTDPVDGVNKVKAIDSREKSASSSAAEPILIFLQYNSLLNNNWAAETAKTGQGADSLLKLSRWLISVRALQLAQVMRLKKLLCEHTVQKIK